MKKSQSVKKLENKYAHLGLRFNPGYLVGTYPTQAFGKIKGMPFYFKFHHNFASLDIGKPFTYQGKEINPTNPHYIVSYAVKDNVTGDKYAGELSDEQAEELFSYLIDNLREYKETTHQKEVREELEKRLMDNINNPNTS